MASQLAFKSRIASTESLKKIFNAQEMIASSRIAKTRDVALAAKPFSDGIYDAVRSLAAHTNIEHPILGKKEDNPRVAVLALTSDRGMAGAYTSSIIRETEELLNRLEADGRKPELFVYGRRGVNYYKYRNREVAATWEGESDAPSVAMAARISKALFDTYMAPASAGGVSEFYIVFTEFINMVVQKVRILRMLPVEVKVLDDSGDDSAGSASAEGQPGRTGSPGKALRGDDDVLATPPLYSFEPSTEEVLDSIMPKYVQSRVHECLLTAAASETASRQNAMHTATDNAGKLVDELTRKLNASRQASITQELTEIVGSADALKNETK